MRFIGITGGVGAGKSAILSYLSEKKGTKVMLADEVAHKLMEPGNTCYHEICKQFREDDILAEDGSFDKGKLSSVIFSDEKKRTRLNEIVHPAVKKYVMHMFSEEKKKGELELLVLEAALLVEEEYDEICDELWYIYTSEQNRRKRLKETRGYSDEKISQIFSSQLSEEEYRNACKVTIDNNGDLSITYAQIEKALKEENHADE